MQDRSTFRFPWKIPSIEGSENEQIKQADKTKRETGRNVCPTSVHAKPGCELLFCGSGFGGFDFGGGVGVFFGEAFDAAGGINQLLFAGEERVAIGADFDI